MVLIFVRHIFYHDRIEHPIVDDGVHGDCDRVPRENLLGRDIKADCPQVNLLVIINAGEDKKYPRAFGSPTSQPSEAENNGSFILLYDLMIYCRMVIFRFSVRLDLDADAQRQGRGEEHQHQRGQRQEQSAAARACGVR